jgi:hypothetical protein
VVTNPFNDDDTEPTEPIDTTPSDESLRKGPIGDLVLQIARMGEEALVQWLTSLEERGQLEDVIDQLLAEFVPELDDLDAPADDDIPDLDDLVPDDDTVEDPEIAEEVAAIRAEAGSGVDLYLEAGGEDEEELLEQIEEEFAELTDATVSEGDAADAMVIEIDVPDDAGGGEEPTIADDDGDVYELDWDAAAEGEVE